MKTWKEYVEKLSLSQALSYLRARQQKGGPFSENDRLVIDRAIRQAEAHSCASCRWQEKGRCYIEPCARRADGRSMKLAISRCDRFKKKQDPISDIVPNELLEIVNERLQNTLS